MTNVNIFNNDAILNCSQSHFFGQLINSFVDKLKIRFFVFIFIWELIGDDLFLDFNSIY